MPKVLVVEDDQEVLVKLKDWLSFERYTVDCAETGNDALERLKFYQYDLIVLDWGLPDVSGVDICKQYRSNGGHSPILMLTGKSQIHEREEGLDSGADDYLVKPFHLKELSARLRALLRRPAVTTKSIFETRHVRLDPASRQVTSNGKPVQLQPLEFALLHYFMRYPDQVLAYDGLLNNVWGNDSDAAIDTLRTYIKALRKKLDVAGERPLIRTVHGVGYVLDS